jgi:hypothetical protein
VKSFFDHLMLFELIPLGGLFRRISHVVAEVRPVLDWQPISEPALLFTRSEECDLWSEAKPAYSGGGM